MCAACRNITPLAPTSFEPAPRTIVAALSTCDEVQQPTRKTLHPSCLHLMSINSPSILTSCRRIDGAAFTRVEKGLLPTSVLDMLLPETHYLAPPRRTPSQTDAKASAYG